jgi:hypothetical protein
MVVMMLMVTIFHLICLFVYAHSDPKAHPQARIKRQDIGCYTPYPSPKLIRAALVGATPTIIHEQGNRYRSHRNDSLRVVTTVRWRP